MQNTCSLWRRFEDEADSDRPGTCSRWCQDAMIYWLARHDIARSCPKLPCTSTRDQRKAIINTSLRHELRVLYTIPVCCLRSLCRFLFSETPDSETHHHARVSRFSAFFSSSRFVLCFHFFRFLWALHTFSFIPLRLYSLTFAVWRRMSKP